MKKQQVDHVLRAAGRITGERQFIIIGSQALHGKYPDLPDEILKSVEVDLMAGKKRETTEWLNTIGMHSAFHASFGYFADPIDLATTAGFPKGWKGRLVNLPPGDTDGVKGLCLEPHDLAIAKYVAHRPKDLIFTRELVRRGLLSKERLLSLLDQTPVSEEIRGRVRDRIGHDFSTSHEVNDRSERAGAGLSKEVAYDVGDEIEAARARRRRGWLKMRKAQRARSSERKLTTDRDRAADSEDHLEIDPDDA